MIFRNDKDGQMEAVVSRGRILELIKEILARQGRSADAITGASPLREVGFRSLDFAELALRVEEEIGSSLDFEAASLRSIATIDDILSFFESVNGTRPAANS